MPAERRLVIAVVDDDQRILESLKNLFESAGFAVRTYLSGRTFLEDSPLSEIDCLITDIGMPDIDGFELQRRVEGARPDVPIILITGDHAISARQRAIGNDKENFFRKPFSGQELLSAVCQALSSSRKLS
ncbi:response regulator (plasmid) [Microvirga terrae]|uniref:Response regulator n=1 Tax=Microvirga terrae TaxID=2740529 RepID=A0ABY5RZI4_9HYPH|nr:response regulator [Microvirga terrae]UVF22646.1 response regulator [Microvirga terrae]